MVRFPHLGTALLRKSRIQVDPFNTRRLAKQTCNKTTSQTAITWYNGKRALAVPIRLCWAMKFWH